MIDALFTQPNYLATKRMLDATALRHEAIASNLANVETPNYKRVDVNPSFDATLKQALAAKDTDKLSSLKPQFSVDATAVAQNTDGNTVQLENELLRLNQNALEHQLETQLVSGALLKLRTAITGRAQ
ncbi:MAG: flagellar basal body rod protein FlgB [Verrucomicrobia bacterium]|nr:flagellar basal body rod protein FlgB [Verrucomicrobiota bacterium]